jgi:peptidoglycan/LPS O-acetylase OafA/YrhL
MVVARHYFGIPSGGSLSKLLMPGRAGVDLFFVLSGFLIGSILISKRGSSNLFRAFYLRRALRILPVYFLLLAVFIIGLTGGWHADLFGDGAFPTWTYALFLQNFESARIAEFGPRFMAVTWSLAIEEQFYLLFPFAVAFVSSRHLPNMLAALIVIPPALRIGVFWQGGHYMPAYVLMPCRADCLAIARREFT